MTLVVILLGGIMALFAVLGYLNGSRSAVLTLLSILGGMAVIASVGGRIITLINTVYRFLRAGGVQALSGGGDLGALAARMRAIGPLIPNDAAGAALLLLLTVLILLAVVLGRYRRFRRPPSGGGFLLGLVSGYLVGAYLLDLLLPSLLSVLPLPFGLGAEIAGGQPPAAAGALPQGSVTAQLLQAIGSASQSSLSLVMMILIVSLILIALLNAMRGGGVRVSRETTTTTRTRVG